MARVDVHQHVWPATLLDELRRRSRGPRVVGDRLLLDGEPDFRVVPGDHVLADRQALDAADDIDLALLSLSSPLGIESLDPAEAEPLLDAWHALALDLGPGHGLWAAVNLVEPDLDDLRRVLAAPTVCGLQVPATALPDPAALERLAPVLAVVEAADRPVLVHPGPAPAGDSGVPGWWPALTSYTSQLTAAWFAWHVAGRALLPTLRICFVALAGLAPLHHERLAARGGRFGAVDRHVYYDTSSYGPRAVDAVTRVVGVDPLVHGSDRPYAEPRDPGLGEAFTRALYVANPHHLLNGGVR
jgi:predicted TIM-barrel fold metal-dependent hydrolase